MFKSIVLLFRVKIYLMMKVVARNIAVLVSHDIFDDVSLDENDAPPMYDLIQKKEYIKPLPKCKYDFIFSFCKRQESLDKKYNLLSVTTWHEFSHILHDKPINKETFFYDGDYL